MLKSVPTEEEQRNSQNRRDRLFIKDWRLIMAVHKYTSWGRTRRPKPASGNDGDYITGSVGVLNLNQLNKNQFNATNGIYKTENT